MQKITFTCTDLPSKDVGYQPVRIVQQFHFPTGAVVEQFIAMVDRSQLLPLAQALREHYAKGDAA